MSSYLILALVPTGLYIVYHVVNITCDLYGKKGTEKTDEEVFSLGPTDAMEESVEVSENETGFSIGNEICDTEAIAVPPVIQDDDTGKKEAIAKERLERPKVKAEAQMEETAPYLFDGFIDEEMYKALTSKGRSDNRPCLKWRPVKDKLQDVENEKDTMCILSHHPLFSSGEKWRCELQLGCGCAGDDVRLRGNDDVLRLSSILCHRWDLCDRVRIPDLHRDEHG